MAKKRRLDGALITLDTRGGSICSAKLSIGGDQWPMLVDLGDDQQFGSDIGFGSQIPMELSFCLTCPCDTLLPPTVFLPSWPLMEVH